MTTVTGKWYGRKSLQEPSTLKSRWAQSNVVRQNQPVISPLSRVSLKWVKIWAAFLQSALQSNHYYYTVVVQRAIIEIFSAMTGFPLFYWQKIQDFSRTFHDPIENFPGPVQSLQMFKYKEKTTFIYNIQSVVHCRKFTMKQNVDVICSEFRWTDLHISPLENAWLSMIFFNDFPAP